MASDTEPYDPATFWLAPARNFRTSARLHLQHLLFQNTLNGLLLDQRIRDSLPSGGPAKVADLACGNGVWLSALYDDLLASRGGAAASGLQLDGYDINPVNFPPAHTLPDALRFKVLNVLEPLPEELEGTYDVVHLRAFSSVVRNDDPSPILKQALALLKPGGWLQWEETRPNRWTTQAPPGSADKTACDTIVHILDAGGRATGSVFGFLGELGEHFTKAGFADVGFQEHDKRPVDFKGWTEDYLMVWEELPALFPAKAQAPNAPMTKEGFTELFAKAVAETEQGVVVHQQSIVVAIGRKPT